MDQKVLRYCCLLGNTGTGANTLWTVVASAKSTFFAKKVYYPYGKEHLTQLNICNFLKYTSAKLEGLHVNSMN